MPDDKPFGDTFLEASVLAITAAVFLNKPAGGCVESVFTSATHRLFLGRLVLDLLVLDWLMLCLLYIRCNFTELFCRRLFHPSFFVLCGILPRALQVVPDVAVTVEGLT